MKVELDIGDSLEDNDGEEGSDTGGVEAGNADVESDGHNNKAEDVDEVL